MKCQTFRDTVDNDTRIQIYREVEAGSDIHVSTVIFSPRNEQAVSLDRGHGIYFHFLWPEGRYNAHRSEFRSEEPTSELHSLMRTQYGIIIMKKKKQTTSRPSCTLNHKHIRKNEHK